VKLTHKLFFEVLNILFYFLSSSFSITTKYYIKNERKLLYKNKFKLCNKFHVQFYYSENKILKY
jgi:hypothetical protein